MIKTMTSFKIQYGRDLIAEVVKHVPAYVLVTMEEIWPIVKSEFNTENFVGCLFTENTDVLHLEKLLEDFPREVKSVIGLGGGCAIDSAKYIASKSGLPLFQIPSTVSTNACFTRTIATREHGKIHYTGNVVPEVVCVDYELIKQAPLRLNRAGLGDAICGYTALYDWRLADKRKVPPLLDPRLVRARRRKLRIIKDNVDEIREVTDSGIKTLMETHKWTGTAAWMNFHSRANHSSEHFFAYNLERMTGKWFIHGELVCLGIVLMLALQENSELYEARKIIEECGVPYAPELLGLSWDEIEITLKTLRDYVVQENFYYSIINEIGVNEQILQSLKSLFQN